MLRQNWLNIDYVPRNDILFSTYDKKLIIIIVLADLCISILFLYTILFRVDTVFLFWNSLTFPAFTGKKITFSLTCLNSKCKRNIINWFHHWSSNVWRELSVVTGPLLVLKMFPNFYRLHRYFCIFLTIFGFLDQCQPWLLLF